MPIYGSPLSLGLARTASRRRACSAAPSSSRCTTANGASIGPFDCEFIPVTHSVPHAFATAYHTPAGTILHSGDFKLDPTPVDGRKTDLSLMGEIAKRTGRREAAAVRLDQRRAARASPRRRPTVGDTMRSVFRDYPDRG